MFLAGTGAGLGIGLGAGLTLLNAPGFRGFMANRKEYQSFSGKSVENEHATTGMPGRYPGRVVEVFHPGSVTSDHRIQQEPVKQMIDRGMCRLTGADHATEAWRKFFTVGDVVGIKVNPVGRKRYAHDIGSISNPEVLIEIVQGLKSAGVKPQDIIVYERYASEFRETGYEKVLRERSMEGVRWLASSADYDEQQTDIEGYPRRLNRTPDRDRHVSGYDPDVFVTMGFANQDHLREKDERRYRSHLSTIVTRMVNKFVTIPVLKDHRSGGVTLALKNLSHGMNNNVCRSHLADIYPSTLDINQTTFYAANQCNTFIPAAVNQQPMIAKATLHIMDGLIGCYEGGPGSWNRSWATWPYRSLFFATDPVAMDHVGWDIIDAKRALEGWPPVVQMGPMTKLPNGVLSPRLALLAMGGSLQSNVALAAAQRSHNNSLNVGLRSEFYPRMPEHIILASYLGLGIFDARKIHHQRETLSA
jgi:uncharacterized protein (DUF362 family)